MGCLVSEDAPLVDKGMEDQQTIGMGNKTVLGVH